ncbi:MAG: hypothetical protein AB7U62_14350, partial [Pseudolabrys sp.]
RFSGLVRAYVRAGVLACLVGGLALGAACGASANPVFPPGSRVGITPPVGMAPDAVGARFQDGRNGATLTVLELPGPAYEQIERGLFAANEPNVTLIKRESFGFDAGLGYLAQVEVKTGGKTLRKWVLLGRAVAGEPTALVTFDVPSEAAAAYPEAKIRETLASVTFRPAPVEEQLNLMPMKLSDLAGFRVVRVHPTLGVLLTDGPKDQSPEQPTLLLSFGTQTASNPSDRQSIARDMLRNFGLPELRIQTTETIRLRNQPVIEVRAEAKDPPSGTELRVVQWMRFSEGGFMRIIAAAPKQDWDAAFPRFRAVRDGIQPR